MLVSTVIFFVLSIAYHLYPPQGRSFFYGYKARFAFKSPEHWQSVNIMLSKYLLVLSLLMLLEALMLSLLELKGYEWVVFLSFFLGLIITAIFMDRQINKIKISSIDEV